MYKDEIGSKYIKLVYNSHPPLQIIVTIGVPHIHISHMGRLNALYIDVHMDGSLSTITDPTQRRKTEHGIVI